MRFFSRRGRSRSMDRTAKSKRDRLNQDQQSYRTDKRSQTCDDSIGSELPTLDQFEIAVPSRSFHSASMGDHNEYEEAREEEDAIDNQSNGDISSITSVSYRAGYYYLRNVKKKTPEKNKSSGCLPSCTCASCMPCSCSWLTCCCCSEAKSELAANNKHSMGNHPYSKGRKSHSPGRRPMMTPLGHGAPGYPHHKHPGTGNRPLSNNRRYHISGDRSRGSRGASLEHARLDQPSPMGGDEGRMYTPSLKRNHSLFDELSEEEEMNGYNGPQRGGRQQQQYNNQKKNKQKQPWLRARAASGGGGSGGGGSGGYGGPPDYYAARDKSSSRNKSRGRGRREERY